MFSYNYKNSYLTKYLVLICLASFLGVDFGAEIFNADALFWKWCRVRDSSNPP
jgi:hypothetical protein